MKITHSLAQLQKEHVVLELECIDRMYLNAYVPKLTSKDSRAPGLHESDRSRSRPFPWAW